MMGLNKPNNEIDVSALAQESTSQEIKSIAGGVQTDIDTLQTEINEIKAKLNEIQNSQSGNEISTTGEGHTLASSSFKKDACDYILFCGLAPVSGIYKIKISSMDECYLCGVISDNISGNPPTPFHSSKYLQYLNQPTGTVFYEGWNSPNESLAFGSFEQVNEYTFVALKNTFLFAFICTTASSSGAGKTISLTYGND